MPGRGQQSVWAGAGSAVQGAQGRVPHLPLVRLPLLQQGSAWSRLGCCEKIRWEEAPQGCGLAPGSSTLSQLQFCSVYVGQKPKNQDGPTSCFFCPLGPLPTRGFQTTRRAPASTRPPAHL